jgi:acyl carrier protein
MNQDLLKILKKTSDFDHEITNESRLEDDLGFTSMRMIMFLNKACKVLGIKIIELDADQIGECKTVEELFNYLSSFKVNAV